MRRKTWLIVAAYVAGWLAAPTLDTFARSEPASIVAEQEIHSTEGIRLASR